MVTSNLEHVITYMRASGSVQCLWIILSACVLAESGTSIDNVYAQSKGCIKVIIFIMHL